MMPDRKHKIEHIVVIMFENRSFDHLLGAIPGVNGVDKEHFNLSDPKWDKSKSYHQPVRNSPSSTQITTLRP
jgi:phospholipase C